ncbi:MAG: hypothetical protein ACOCQG_03940 [Candidatus Nanoarchaeia archaeon]
MVLCLFVFAGLAFAQDQVVINSRDWQDIYSGMIYAKINDADGRYPIEETRAELLLQMLDTNKEELMLIESGNRVLSGYRSRLETRGFDVEVFESENINLELAGISNASGFIVMDDVYPHSSVSIAPFAVLKNYYVLFANADNIEEVIGIISEEGGEVIQYGHVDREVSDELEQFSPIVIDSGSKFENNIEIVEMFKEEANVSQFILTDGSFLEPQFFSGSEPVVFIGRTNTPDSTIEFLKESEIKNGIVIGNELVDLASNLKNEVGMNFLAKFAQGFQQEQYTLDIINLPEPDYNPVVSEVMYNTNEDELVVSIENEGVTPVMFIGTYVISKDNETIATVGDDDAVFLPGQSTSTQTYDVDLEDEGEIEVQANVIYGEEEQDLENLNEFTLPIDFLEIIDNSNISLEDVHYDRSINRFIIEIKNIGEDTVYATAFFEDLIINDRAQRLGTDELLSLAPGESDEIRIRADLTPLDIEENPQIRLNLRYGAQANMLLNHKQEERELVVAINEMFIIAGAVLLAITVIIFLLLKKRKKKRKGKKHKTKKEYKQHSQHIPPPPPPKKKH